MGEQEVDKKKWVLLFHMRPSGTLLFRHELFLGFLEVWGNYFINDMMMMMW